MGNTTSENEINESLKEVTQETNNVFQNSYLGCYSDNEINLDGCTVFNLDINQNASCATNQNFNAHSNTQQLSKECESSQIQQIAEAVSQNLSLNPGSTTAKNITRETMTAVTDINNDITQGCSTIGTQGNRFKCSNTSIYGGNVSQKESQEEVSKCRADSAAVQSSTQSLTSSITQKSKAIQKDAIFWTLIASAILVLSFGITAKLADGAIQDICKWLVILIVILTVCAMVFVLFYNEENRHKLKPSIGNVCADCSQYHKEECGGTGSPPKDAYCKWDNDMNSCICNDVDMSGVNCATQCYLFHGNKDDCNANYCMYLADGTCTGGRDPKTGESCQTYVRGQHRDIPLS